MWPVRCWTSWRPGPAPEPPAGPRRPAPGTAGLPIVLAGVLSLAACGREPAVQAWHFEAFATPVTVQVAGSEAAGARAARSVEDFLGRVQDDWYAYGTGELARVNAALASGRSVDVSPELAAIIRRAQALHRLSGGRFDPSVADLVALWHFDRIESLEAASGPPSPEAVAALLRGRGGMDDLQWSGNRLSSRRPLRLDLNGLVKGTAAARAREILAAAGIRDALVDLGGSSLVALGQRGERPWRIGVRQPRPGAAGAEPGVIAVLELLPGEALSTSGDYERYLEAGGRRYGHILDPRTGYPVRETAAATVVHPDPELAEAATKALMVAGPREMSAVCAAMGLRYALIVTVDGQVQATEALQERLDAASPPTPPEP